MTAARAARARQLAERYDAASEALSFCASIAEFQAGVPPAAPLEALAGLLDLVQRVGTPLLRDAARDLDEAGARVALAAYRDGRDTESLRSVFARVLLQPSLAAGDPGTLPGASPDRCPRCGHLPQVACLRPEGDGTAMSLQCSLCLWEWPYERDRCPACGRSDQHRIAYFGATEYPHVQVRACESCRRYLHTVSLEKDPAAVPDVDEVAALPLDLWAGAEGYRKLRRNLVGM